MHSADLAAMAQSSDRTAALKWARQTLHLVFGADEDDDTLSSYLVDRLVTHPTQTQQDLAAEASQWLTSVFGVPAKLNHESALALGLPVNVSSSDVVHALVQRLASDETSSDTASAKIRDSGSSSSVMKHASPVPDSSWPCPLCTFENSKLLTTCEMCGHNASLAPAATASPGPSRGDARLNSDNTPFGAAATIPEARLPEAKSVWASSGISDTSGTVHDHGTHAPPGLTKAVQNATGTALPKLDVGGAGGADGQIESDVTCKVVTSVVQHMVSFKTRSGNVMHVARERYLRDDVECFSPLCTHASCAALEQDRQRQGVAIPMLGTGEDCSHYAMPSAKVLLRFLEVLEFTPSWTDVILLRSELEYFNAQSSARAFNSLKRLIADPRRRIVVFNNVHCKQTFRHRKADVPLEEHMQHLLFVAAKWYTDHINKQMPVVVVSDSAPASEFTSGVLPYTMADYINLRFPDNSEISDLYKALLEAEEAVASSAMDSRPTPPRSGAKRSTSQLYEEHLDEELLRGGLKSGLFFSGHIRVNKYRSHEAIVDCGKAGARISAADALGLDTASDSTRWREVFIPSSELRNRSVDGDEVVVELLPRGEWTGPDTRLGGANEASGGGGGGGSRTGKTVMPTGRVVGVLQRHWRSYVATIQKEDTADSSKRWVLCVPMDQRIPKIRIQTRQVARLGQQRLVVHIRSWAATSTYPEGYYVRSLGTIGDVETEVRAILLENGIGGHTPFQEDMVKKWLGERIASRPALQLSAEQKSLHAVGCQTTSPKHATGAGTADSPYAWSIPEEALIGRRDLRESHRGCVCSIDPPGCTDIDDALSVYSLPNGNLQLGVHIADVTHFVPHGSRLDMEARSRATTVYLVDRRLDMLPSALSEDLCSLRGGTDRLAVSVLWEVDQNYQVISTWMGRTAIHNSFALSYGDAQKLIDSEFSRPLRQSDVSTMGLSTNLLPSKGSTAAALRDLDLLRPKLRHLLMAGRVLRGKRLQAGALELDSLQLHFQLDGSKKPVDVMLEQDLEVHHTIAEFMIAANCTVATFIQSVFPNSALLRRHPGPQPHKFRELQDLASTQRLQMDMSSNLALARSLAAGEREAERRKDPWLVRILKNMATRAMSEAQYFSTGSGYEVHEFQHYGLAAPFYTHFTSPIRRYADVVVHNLLMRALEVSRRTVRSVAPPFNNDSLSSLCDHLNAMNRNAKIASDESAELFLSTFLRHLQQKQPQESNASSVVRQPSDSKTLVLEAIVFAVQDNGVKLVIPQYEFKTAAFVVDRDGHLVLTEDEEKSDQAPIASTVCDKAEGTLTVNLSGPGVLAHGLKPSYVLRVFDRIPVTVFVKSAASHYRRTRPSAVIAWPALVPRGGSAGSRPADRTESGQDESSQGGGRYTQDLKRLAQAVKAEEKEKAHKALDVAVTPGMSLGHNSFYSLSQQRKASLYTVTQQFSQHVSAVGDDAFEVSREDRDDSADQTTEPDANPVESDALPEDSVTADSSSESKKGRRRGGRRKNKNMKQNSDVMTSTGSTAAEATGVVDALGVQRVKDSSKSGPRRAQTAGRIAFSIQTLVRRLDELALLDGQDAALRGSGVRGVHKERSAFVWDDGTSDITS